MHQAAGPTLVVSRSSSGNEESCLSSGQFRWKYGLCQYLGNAVLSAGGTALAKDLYMHGAKFRTV